MIEKRTQTWDGEPVFGSLRRRPARSCSQHAVFFGLLGRNAAKRAL